MFVEPEDFASRPYRILNIQESTDFEDFIESKEEKLLKKLIGIELYGLLVSGLETSGTIEEKWEKLRDGEVFEYQNQTYEWVGMKALLVPAVFSEWVREGVYKYTAAGVVVNMGQQNSETISPADKIVMGWNEFHRHALVLFLYLIKNEELYPEADFHEPGLLNKFNM
jgi:hypothetical protein